jgi:hypothetical protein
VDRFFRATRIKTAEGEINTEDLRIGDNVLTALVAKPIKFIDRSKALRRRTGPWKNGEGPVKISRFEGKAPHLDLYVPGDHAIYEDGILIPAGNLVKDVTIVVDDRPELLSLTVFHTCTKPSWRRVWQPRPFSSITNLHMHFGSTMQTSLSHCTANPGSLRLPLCRPSVIEAAAKNWRGICAAPLRQQSIRKPIEQVCDHIIDRLARAP